MTKSGTLCIFVRHGGSAYKGANHDAEPFYTLVREAHIKARFPIEQVVTEAVEQANDANFDRAVLEVLTNRDLGWARVRL